jgi:ATP-binding cassette subfamily C protein
MSISKPVSELETALEDALRSCRPHFIATAAFSAFGNLLFVAPTLYLMQVYDRVLPTGGLETLTLLSLIAAAALALQAGLDWMRARILVRTGAQLDETLSGSAVTLALARQRGISSERLQVVRDFDAMRTAVSGPAILAVLDAPWAPIYLVLASLLHPAFGVLTLVGGGMLLTLAILNERRTRGPLREAAIAATRGMATLDAAIQTSDTVQALGMGPGLTKKHLSERARMVRLQVTANFTGSSYTSAIKGLRLALQSISVGLGAYLAVKGHISGGAVMASSFLLARALSPVEQISGAWPQLDRARNAYSSLRTAFRRAPSFKARINLPDPQGRVSLEGISVTAPDGERVILNTVSLAFAPGQIVGISGPSGSGKSTLIQAIVGAVPLCAGAVRFDESSIDDWNAEQLARFTGYLPQTFTLYQGTVRDNISRFQTFLTTSPAQIDSLVVGAAQAAGAHEMIARLPHGYDTPLGVGGSGLSGGQAQRIALARALFGNPRILVLDEPNAHLDNEAEARLLAVLTERRAAGATVIIAAHAQAVLNIADTVVVLKDGTVDIAGPLRDVAAAMRVRAITSSVPVQPEGAPGVIPGLSASRRRSA